jgi:hypothetical protein
MRLGPAMANSYRDGKYYRQRAAECCALADTLQTLELRKQMEQIAADYERMAIAVDEARDLG